jgi:hypothetical protein
LPDNALQGVYWKVIGWYVLASIALSTYFLIGTGLVGWIDGAFHQPGEAETLSKTVFLAVLLLFGYFAVIVSLNVVIRVYLVRDVWKKVLLSVRVKNIAAAADVASKGDLASALGEGFADGLDVAGF